MSSRRIKLLCTLGPKSSTPRLVRALAEVGTDLYRVNMSHGAPEDHARAVELVRKIEGEVERDLAVVADLPGPKIRLGELDGDPVRLHAGGRFVLRAAPGRSDQTGATTTYPRLAEDLRPGDRVLLADGAVELLVRDAEDGDVTTEVVRGGQVRSRAGVNVPAQHLSLPAITDRDRECLSRALDLGFDLVAQSFVRSADDVSELRALMGDRPVPVIAKVETRPAVDSFDGILGVSDAVMVARGDLGVELALEEIPLLQKELLVRARAAGKAAIVATQMLESMIRAPRPTRAEASDVANAVLDGADAIMLSGETAIGAYPVEAARVAARIAGTAEERAGSFRVVAAPRREADEAAAVAHAAGEVADGNPHVVAIACFTRTGRTAALLSAERPGVPIYAFIPDRGIRRSLCVRWGVTPLPAGDPNDTDEMISLMDEGLRAAGLAGPGQSVVMVASSPAGKVATNMLKVHQLGEASP